MLLRKFQRENHNAKAVLSDWLTMALASVEIHYFHFENIVPTKLASSAELFVEKFTQTIFEILSLLLAFFFQHL